jgi:hypothetical protein
MRQPPTVVFEEGIAKHGHLAPAAVDERAYDRFVSVRERFRRFVCDAIQTDFAGQNATSNQEVEPFWTNFRSGLERRPAGVYQNS